jgi:two-component system NtrC family sensor kinase
VQKDLQLILDAASAAGLSEADAAAIAKAVKGADRAFTVLDFKVTRIDAHKRATAVLLEETIVELQQKSDAVERINASLHGALDDLKAAQAQLVFSEKMASLGALVAGVAHEIRNPINFVINFAQVCVELGEEIAVEVEGAAAGKGDALAEVPELLAQLIDTQKKIQHHGERAESIIKNMLLHSRGAQGVREPVDLNKLLLETVLLAYQSVRAEHKDFRCEIRADYSDELEPVTVVAQDISRVFLNIIGNAFYALNERRKATGEGFLPELLVATASEGSRARVTIRDNGTGIPKKILDKVFNPFFTTKPAGSGTGLGLSLSFDMVKAHGGNLQVTSEEGLFTEFAVSLPLVT